MTRVTPTSQLSAQSKHLRCFDTQIKHSVTGRTENPNHVRGVFVDGPPRAVAFELRSMCEFQHSRFTAAACLARAWKFWVFPHHTVEQCVRSLLLRACGVVVLLRVLVSFFEALKIQTARLEGAVWGAILLIRSMLHGAVEHRPARAGDRLAHPGAFRPFLSVSDVVFGPTSRRAVFAGFVVGFVVRLAVSTGSGIRMTIMNLHV